MLVIHGIWARDALCLWAEDSALPASVDTPAGGRPSRAPRPHPFAADPGVLGDALGLLGEGPRDLAGKAAADELSLWLPSAGPGPAVCPRADPGRGDARCRPARRAALGCWRVPALAFGPAAALTLLAALDPVDSPPAAAVHPDLIAGGSAVYWAAVARFAADLCARGRVLPVLEQPVLVNRVEAPVLTDADDGWAAAWRPVLTGPDAPRAAELAGAMPPVCRAGEPGGEPPGPLLAAALDALADAAARARLDASRTLLPPRRGRRPARIPVAERWAAALTGPDGGVEVATAEDEAEAAGLAAGLDGLARRRPGPGRPGAHLLPPGGAGAARPGTQDREDPAQDPGPQNRAEPPADAPGTSSSPSSRPRIPA